MAKSRSSIDYATQKGVSYSQYSMYKSCQYQWYLSYAKQLKIFKPGIHLCYGTSLHEAIQHYLQVMYSESIKKADEINLPLYFEERMIENYKNDISSNNNEHYTTKEEFTDFINDGKASLEWFKKHRAKYFSKNEQLKGIEHPIIRPISEHNKDVVMIGYIDLVLYSPSTNTYTVYDIKTSTRGWSDKEKKDETKLSQVLLYKKFYSEELNVPEENVQVKFFIIKRKIYESAEFPIPRIQEFVPAQGTTKVKKSFENFLDFVKNSFDENAQYNINRVYSKNTSSCRYCPYNDKLELCDKMP